MTRAARIRLLVYASVCAALLLPHAGERSARAVIDPSASQTATTPSAEPLPVPSEAAPEVPEPLPAPTSGAGDLTHLAFTATGDLSATLVSPEDGSVTSVLATSLVVATVKGAGVEVSVAGKVVPFANIGKREVDTKTGLTRYTYYGVPLVAGPNLIALTPLGAAGLRGKTITHTIFGPGRVASLSFAATGVLRADGASIDELHLRARDAWDHPVDAGHLLHVVLISGDAQIERATQPAPPSNATPVPLPTSSTGIVTSTVPLQTIDVGVNGDGEAIVRLRPGLRSGNVVLRIEADGVSEEERFFLAPSLRKPFVTGLVQAGVGQVPGIPDAPDSVADGTSSRRGRIALFAVGAVGQALASVAYDTSNTLQRTAQSATVSGADADDKPYDVTGDSSTRYDDALSRDHLYARIDDGRASAEWGEFRAQTGPDGGLGGFDQLVDGAKVSVDAPGTRVSAFAASNDIGYDRRTFAPTGLANGVFLKPSIVVGSEVVILASIDRRTGAVLAQTPLTRGVDYTLDYTSGALRFINVPLPFDDSFNPQEIVLTYEFDDPGNSAKTAGGRVETSLGKDVHAGAGYVNDSSGSGNLTLMTEDLGGKLQGGSWSIEHASSTGALPSLETGPVAPGAGGSALNAQYAQTIGPSHLSLLYNQTSAGYDNPFGGLSTPGLLDEHLTYAYQMPGAKGEIGFDVSHQSNSGLGGASSQTTETLRARRLLSKRFSLHASLERTNASNVNGFVAQLGATPSPSPTPLPLGMATPVPAAGYQSSTQAQLGADWKIAPPLDLSVDHIATLSGANSTQPTQTDAQLTYQISKDSRAYARERWSASPVQSFATSTEALTAPTNGTHATEFGIEQRVGPATTIDTSYGIDGSANGGDVYSAIGVRERLSFGRIHGDAYVQHGTDTSSVAGGVFNVYGTSLTYGDPSNRFHASEQIEWRTGATRGLSLNIGAVGEVAHDFSLFANINDSDTVGQTNDDQRVGLAWRPSRNDDGVTLLQYERETGSGTDLETQSGVLSLEQVLRVGSGTEVVGRLAYKVDGDSLYAAKSSLAGLRIDQKLGSRFDLGAEVRHANVLGVDGATSTALALEGGVRVAERTRLGFGYNFSASADPSLSTTPTRRGFYLTVTSVVDRLLGWGAH